MNIEPLKPSWTGSHQIDYNTALPYLVLPEYGRNIQRMVNHAISIEDREERNKVAQAIIVVMGQLNPQLRDVTDFKHKLWDHLFIISEFKLDVDSPYPKPTPESFNTKPERVNYPSGSIRYKPYGKIAEEIIAQAQIVPEGEAKDYLIELVANLQTVVFNVYTFSRFRRRLLDCDRLLFPLVMRQCLRSGNSLQLFCRYYIFLSETS